MPMIPSPRTQAMGAVNAGSTGDEAKSLFDQGLSQMAYNVLINKLPNVAPDVVTFKILDTKPDEGSGVGAFVISRSGQMMYVPVVMADNQIKPLDILYFKDLNVFVPLTKEWLDEIAKMSLGELGQGTVPPQTLSRDVDIRNVVVPPTTGRYSYAADSDACAFNAARDQQDSQPAFLAFLDRAPNRVKRAAARLFETHTRLLKTAVWHYGKGPLLSALELREEKVAAEGKLSRSGGLFIASKKTKPSEFNEIWGDGAATAFQGVAVKSFYAKDERKNLKRAVKTQNELKLTEPKEAGAYRLWKRDGTPLLAFIVNGAQDFFRYGSKCCGSSYRSNESWRKPTTTKRFVGVTEDGKLLDVHNIVGEPIPLGELEGSKVYKQIVSDEAKTGPRVGQWGVFVRGIGAGGAVITVPVYVRSVTTADGVKKVEVAESEYERAETVLLVLDGDSRNLHARGTSVFHLSRDSRWVPVTGGKWDARYRGEDFIQDPRDVFEFAVNGLQKHGAERFVVKKSSQHGFLVGDKATRGLDFVEALEKVARDAQVSVEEAESILSDAAQRGCVEFWAITDTGLAKFAAEDGGDKKKSPPKKDGGGGDPAQDAMDQVMPGPPPPSPVDLAVAEQVSNLQGQMQAIQNQMQMLQTVQQRANFIAGGGGAAAAPAAAAAALGGPMPPEMMGAGQPFGMPPPEAQAMQTGMMQGGQPPMAGGRPPGPPMGGAGAPSAGSAAGSGMPPGMDPSMQGQQPPPMATMTADDGSMDSILQQVNPQFLDAAAGLNDAGAFDAAALASMAQTPQLKDLVSSYIPNLEKSLDNIGRVLLTLWMDEGKIKEDIGDETFIGLEDNLRTVFKGLGQLILRINQNTAVLRAGTDPVQG